MLMRMSKCCCKCRLNSAAEQAILQLCTNRFGSKRMVSKYTRQQQRIASTTHFGQTVGPSTLKSTAVMGKQLAIDGQDSEDSIHEEAKKLDDILDKFLAKEIDISHIKMEGDEVELLEEFDTMFGSNFVKEPTARQDLSQMEEGTETSSRPTNRFRKILYEEGELDRSDLSKPPSRQNPHPFDPSTLPPIHSRSLAVYANHLDVLKCLLDLGMDLFSVEKNTNIGRYLVRLNLEKDVKPKIHWLVEDIGVPPDELGHYLTRNPYFLTQKLQDMKERVNYLIRMRFTATQIAKIVTENRYWLNMDYKLMDSRLGWLQRQFRMPTNDMRKLLVMEPRIVYFGLGPIQRLILHLNRECGFSPPELRQIIREDPRVFMVEPKVLLRTYRYLTNVMHLRNEQIVRCPTLLRCMVTQLRKRHEFLLRLKMANYDESHPKYVPLDKVIHPSDKYFAEQVAGKFISDYNRFLKYI